jgi:hypothetical protein
MRRGDGRQRPEREPPPWSLPWFAWVYHWMSAEFRSAVRDSSTPAALSETAGSPGGSPSRQLLLVLTLAGVAPFAVGFALPLHDFIAHFLAAIAGLILGAVLAVTLIDRLLAQRRTEEWDIVRKQMLGPVCERIVEMASDFAAMIPHAASFLDRVAPEPDPFARPEIATALDELVNVGEAAISRLAAEIEEVDRASSRVLYDQVAALIVPLQGTTTTRIVSLGEDPGLVSHLLELERAQQQWLKWLEMVEHDGAPDSFAWEQAVLTLATAGVLYRYILAGSVPPPHGSFEGGG